MAELEIIDGDGRRRRGRPGENFADGARGLPAAGHAFG
jgi:hypothetical protein